MKPETIPHTPSKKMQKQLITPSYKQPSPLLFCLGVLWALGKGNVNRRGYPLALFPFLRVGVLPAPWPNKEGGCHRTPMETVACKKGGCKRFLTEWLSHIRELGRSCCYWCPQIYPRAHESWYTERSLPHWGLQTTYSQPAEQWSWSEKMPAEEEVQSSLSLHPNILSHPAYFMTCPLHAVRVPDEAHIGDRRKWDFNRVLWIELITKSNWQRFFKLRYNWHDWDVMCTLTVDHVLIWHIYIFQHDSHHSISYHFHHIT